MAKCLLPGRIIHEAECCGNMLNNAPLLPKQTMTSLFLVSRNAEKQALVQSSKKAAGNYATVKREAHITRPARWPTRSPIRPPIRIRRMDATRHRPGRPDNVCQGSESRRRTRN